MKVGERVQWECHMEWKCGEEFDFMIKPVALGATMLVFERATGSGQPVLEKQLLLQE